MFMRRLSSDILSSGMLSLLSLSLLVLVLFTACKPVVPITADNISGDDQTGIPNGVDVFTNVSDDNTTGFGQDDLIKEYEFLTDENLKEFRIYPACEKGRQAVGLSYRFELIQKETIFQLSENNFTFTDFDTYNGLIEKHKNFLICSDCPANTTLHFEPGKVYYARLLNDWYQGGAAVSEVFTVDLTDGSDYMTNECNQAPDDVLCFDSDGMNYTVKGHVFTNGKKFVDYCDIDNPNFLYEFYCDGAVMKKEREWCDKGCRDGYCKT
ncbi:hypothetical protein JW968_04905 [Candidatus Woesearchaeota archaeon]|nr:hypothetical protein [Candidatus Woesearchaeota archaeon]